ncbi:ABC transporter [bacterium]|nr:ABC transporter [bacterium]
MTQAGLPWLWQYARPHRPKIIVASIYETLGKVMDVAPEILIGIAIDVIVKGQDSMFATVFGITDKWHQLLILAGINLVVWMLESLFGYLSATAWRNLSQTIEHEIRTKLYAHVQNLEVSWFEDNSSGGLLSILNDDINQLERFLDTGASSFIRLFWNIILVGAVFAASSLLVTVLAMIPIPIIVWGSIFYQKRLKPRYTKVREAVAGLSSTLSANLGGITTIKAFTSESREAERLATVSNEYRTANQEAIKFSAAFVPLIRMGILTGFTGTLLVGGWLALNGTLSVGIYSVLVFMTQRLLWPLTSLGETLDQFQRFLASTHRIQNLFDTKPQMVEGQKTLATPIQGEINLQNVTFSYIAGTPVLKGVSMHIPAGETHAIVGATGSGKSTIIRLLLRFHDPISGQVTLDGLPLTDLSYSALRGAIGFVSQDVFLFHGTVRENIGYGKPDATTEEIEASARSAEAHEFILALPNGYDTIVGERGQKLSGGQRQRISIARAILRDPAILVLDEATSAVDNETEAAIQRSLAVVTKGRTAVMIAHRLSTIRDADKIWVLENGEIIESGTHDQLSESNGLYAALWRVQTGQSQDKITHE